jgi:CNT family concentrative nucleoside transporter
MADATHHHQTVHSTTTTSQDRVVTPTAMATEQHHRQAYAEPTLAETSPSKAAPLEANQLSHGVNRAQAEPHPGTPPDYSDGDAEKGGMVKSGHGVDPVDASDSNPAEPTTPPRRRYTHTRAMVHVAVILLALTWWIPQLAVRPGSNWVLDIGRNDWVGTFLVWAIILLNALALFIPSRIVTHAIIMTVMTGWWVASLVLHRDDKNWLVPFLLWLVIALRILTYYLPARYLSQAIRFVWVRTVVPLVALIPARFRTLLGGLGALAVVILGAFVSEEYQDNTRENRAISLLGLLLILFAFWATSKHRHAINWQTVINGMLCQYIIGLFVLRTQAGYDIFRFIADRAGDLLGFARDGVAFLVGDEIAQTQNFFFSVLPAIIFFISLCQILFHIGFLQWFVGKFAAFVFWALGVSGAEAVVAAATPFIGQGESAMLVRPFIAYMTKAEIHQIMTCGFATISGSVLVGYIGMGFPPAVLVSSCIMSIPASLAISKMRYPETEETLTAGRVVIPDDDEHNKAENSLHAFANGAALGIRIAGTIIASLLCIIAAVALLNGLLTWWGRYINIDNLTIQLIIGYIFYPIAFLLGVPRDNRGEYLVLIGRLIAEKVVTNEFNAFLLLSSEAYQVLSPRAQLIGVYSICGFGNIGSLGIQIGIFGQLAPTRGGDVSRLAFSALVSGVMASLTSAAVAGLIVTSQGLDFNFVAPDAA